MKDLIALGSPDSSPSAPPPAPRALRLPSIDLLRGLVIALMVLDHTRDFFHRATFHGPAALDVEHTTVVLYLTRWVTHLCAPTFVFLAGVSAFLRGDGRGSRRELSRFLVTRGLWLMLLELTVIGWFGWAFEVTITRFNLAVIWALGACMVVLAALVWLPRWAIAAFGVALVVGHHLTDSWSPSAFGAFAPLWRILHVRGAIDEWAPTVRVWVTYPIVPWLGVMALGYAFGTVVQAAPAIRRRWLATAGVGSLLLFAVLRATRLYGDPEPWVPHPDLLRSIGLFFDCRKYPPSLQYLLVTLGLSLLLWLWFERNTPWMLRSLRVFGATPMFAYLVHLPLIHALSVGIHELLKSDGRWLFGTSSEAAPDAGFDLWVTYAVWLVVLALLYPACKWFANLKRRRKDGWLSYL